MYTRRESSVERAAVERIKKALGISGVKMTGTPWSRGMPDRMFLVGLGHVVFVEFKRPGSEDDLTVLQEARIKDLRARGYAVLVTSTPSTAYEFVLAASIKVARENMSIE